MELFDSFGKRGVRGRYDNEVVLLVLETGGDVGSRVAGLFKLEVLGLVLSVEGVAHDFPFTAKLVAVTHGIRGQVVTGLGVAEKAGLVGLDGHTLAFESEVGVERLDNPGADVVVDRVGGGLLFARLGRVALG